ncbi:hypothetical protein [Streptomyces sp. NPDC055036]
MATLPRGTGHAVLETLRSEGHQMGPVVDCGEHKVVKILVTPGLEPFREDVLQVRRSKLWCPGVARECPALWLLPDGVKHGLTDASTLFDLVRRVRDPRWAWPPQPARQPLSPAGQQF